jgi:hypothetical protein
MIARKIEMFKRNERCEYISSQRCNTGASVLRELSDANAFGGSEAIWLQERSRSIMVSRPILSNVGDNSSKEETSTLIVLLIVILIVDDVFQVVNL